LSFTRGHRQIQFAGAEITGKSVEEIKKMDDNDCQYPAFVGIRWGFAEIENNKLTATDKWKNRHKYDEYGDPI